MKLADVVAEAGALKSQPAVWAGDRTATWEELHSLYVDGLRKLAELDSSRIAFVPQATAASVSLLAVMQRLRCDCFLLSDDMSTEQQSELAEQFNLAAIVDATGSVTPTAGSTASPQPANEAHDGSLTILTSGTTGRPKAVRHSWQSLTRPVRIREMQTPPIWLLAFRPQLYAGLQVILQALLNRGTLVMAPASEPPDTIVELMTRAGVEFASATPSYWRRLLMLVDESQLRPIPFQQITLGGEAVDQPLLDRLSSIFPQARIVHIYATTEMGRCFSVVDGQAGFPKAFLDQPTRDGVELRIDAGQLWVRSSNAMQGYDQAGGSGDDLRGANDGWFATKDLVEVAGDRVFFVGRDSDMINVGGNKVHPGPIELMIRELPEVEDVRVYGVDSSVAGQLVACQAVARESVDAADARQKILALCHERLERYQCPRLVEMVDELALTHAGKIKRG